LGADSHKSIASSFNSRGGVAGRRVNKTYDHAGYQINFSPSSHQGSTYVDVTTMDKTGVIQP